MSGATHYSPAEADMLETLTADLTEAEWDATWKVYEERGYDAAALVASAYKTAFKATYKVTEAAPVVAEKWKKAGAPPILQDQPKRPKFNAATDYFAKAMGADQAKRR